MTSLQNLFVAKLPRNLTDSDLEQIFVEYNPTSAKVMLDATTGKSKGFGFVLFESEKAGRLAYEKLNKTHVTLHGHNFNLCIFPSKHDGKVATEESNTLYVRNIPMKLSQVEVEQFLRGFGPLTYCAMREEKSSGNVWVVYAEYDTVESAKSALMSLHGNRTYFNTSVAILAKYADSDEAKRERRRRREQQQEYQQQLETMRTNESMGPGSSGSRGFGGLAPMTQSPPPPPMRQNLGNSRRGNGLPQLFATHEMHMEGAVAGAHPPSFASISHHFIPSRPVDLPPPPQLASPENAAVASVTAPTTMAPFVSLPPPPPPSSSPPPLPQQSTATSSTPSFSMPQPPTPSWTGPFLNVAFNPSCANTMSGTFPHFSGVEQTPSRGSPGTPLNFSFGTEMENSGALPNSSGTGSAAMLDAAALAPMTPLRRNSNLSTSSSYRHNPYAPVTPVTPASSTHSSGPGTPVNTFIVWPPAPNVNMHYGASHHRHGSPTGSYSAAPGIGVAGNHFSNRQTTSFLAAPTGAAEANSP